MSMIIESLPFERCGRSSRSSAVACGARLLVPAKVAGAFACDRVQRTRSVAGALKGFEGFTTHRGVNVEVRHAANGAKLLQHEEDDAVVHQAAPVAATNQVSFFFGQPRRLETCFRIAQESLAMARLDHPVQVVVGAV